MSRDGFSDSVDTGTSDWEFEEELLGKDMVLDVWVRDIDGVREEYGDWVYLEERSDFCDFEVCVESVAEY